MAQAVETRFTRSGDVDIAYQVIGDGDRLKLAEPLARRAN